MCQLGLLTFHKILGEWNFYEMFDLQGDSRNWQRLFDIN